MAVCNLSLVLLKVWVPWALLRFEGAVADALSGMCYKQQGAIMSSLQSCEQTRQFLMRW